MAGAPQRLRSAAPSSSRASGDGRQGALLRLPGQPPRGCVRRQSPGCGAAGGDEARERAAGAVERGRRKLARSSPERRRRESPPGDPEEPRAGRGAALLCATPSSGRWNAPVPRCLPWVGEAPPRRAPVSPTLNASDRGVPRTSLALDVHCHLAFLKKTEAGGITSVPGVTWPRLGGPRAPSLVAWAQPPREGSF